MQNLDRIERSRRLAPRFRLLLWAPGVSAALAAAVTLAILLPPLLRQGVNEGMLDALDVLAPLVAREADGHPDALQAWVQRAAGGSALRVTVLAADGRVVADSSRDEAGVREMENHAARPEVRQALATGSGESVRRSATTEVDYAYAARRVHLADGRTWVVRIARPLRALDALYVHLLGVLLASLLTGTMVATGVAFWFRRRVLAPFADLLREAELLAAGDPHRRLSEPELPELKVLSRSLNRLAGRVEEQIAAKEVERRQLAEILSGLHEGVLVIDPDGKPVFANAALRTLFGLPADTPPAPLLELVRQWRVDRLVRGALVGTPGSGEFSFGGRPLALVATPRPAGGGALLVARDLSESERTARVRRDFVANVSHELKTPLAVIRAAAETLADAGDDSPVDEETNRRFVLRIVEQCHRLDDLLRDLLTLARLENPEALARHRPVALPGLVHRALETAGSLAEQRGVALRSEVAELPPLDGDEPALEQLVLNLLDNAIKYNRPGGEVTLRLLGDEGAVRIEVADSGIGIPADEIPRIFERFYRVDKGRGRSEGGTGLGLAIVKHVAQHHGGSVEVESTPGVGSRFRVRLPAAPPRDVPPPAS